MAAEKTLQGLTMAFGCPEAHCVRQAGLKLTKMHLPLPP